MLLFRTNNISKHIKIIKKHIMKMETTAQSNNKTIKEGQAEVCLTTEKVFYNPVQEFNRDLSIAVLTTFIDDYKSEKLTKLERKNKGTKEEKCNDSTDEIPEINVTILEALSATGLRSIRYAKEIPNVTKIIANDLSDKAVETIKSNIKHNEVEHLIEASHDDACMVMYKHKHYTKRFSAIDLDPYGCPSIFLDAAVQSVDDGGLLLVTATDMAILCGNCPETCYTKYGAVSLKIKCCHEMALRIMLQCIESHANRYGRYIVPLLSISADFYIRVFVKIYSGPAQCKKTTSKLSMVYHCTGCDTVTLQPLGGWKPNPSPSNPLQQKGFLPTGPRVKENCDNCNQKHHLGGPIWSAPIHDQTFVTRLLTRIDQASTQLGTARRIQGVLGVVEEELDTPLYWSLDRLCGRLHVQTVPMMIMRSAILNAGYEVSYSHASKVSIKTNAPPSLVWDIVREWAKTNPPKPSKIEVDPVAAHILSRPFLYRVDLSEHPAANPASRRAGRLRYQANPAPHWGPGARANVNVGEEKVSKQVQNQNKYSKNKKGKRPRSPQSEEEARKVQITEETDATIVDKIDKL